MRDVVVSQRVGIGIAEEKVRPVVVADGRSAGIGVAAAVGEGTVERVVVVHRHPDSLVLVTELHGVLAPHPGEVDLRVDQGRILPLRVCALAAKTGEAGDADRRLEPPATTGLLGSPGMKPGWLGGECRVADGEVELAGLRAIQAEAGIDHLVGSEKIGVTQGDLLVEDSYIAVGLAVRGELGMERVVDAVLLAVANAQEG